MFDQSRIDLSKPMTQLLESLGDLNQTIRSGFSIVAACSDNWRQLCVLTCLIMMTGYPS